MGRPEELVGTTVGDGRYAISGVLGAGSQGDTLEAVDKRDGRLVAVKRFQIRGARSWKDVELAEREAKVLASLSHRLLPAAIDRFEEDGALFLVMEKIEGESLAERGVASREEVLEFLRDAAELLDHLHGRSPPVIHRDIKPGNVIRRPPRPERGETAPSYVLVDFGSVRQRLEPRGGSTVVGTFGYMAPEQLQGRAMPATDVYAVGATALRLLTGVEPEDLPHRGLAIDVEAALGKRDRDLSAILGQMLEPDPDRRAERIAPLLASLDAPRGGAPAPRRANPKSDAPDQGARTRGARADERDARRSHRKERRAAKRARQREERAERAAARFRSAPPAIVVALYAPAVIIALAVARIAVAMSLRVVVPIVLALLAIVFGEGLRRAAAAVDDAGIRADRAISRARARALARPPIPSDPSRKRVAVDEPPPRAEEPLEEAARDIEASLEQMAEELQEEAERRRRR